MDAISGNWDWVTVRLLIEIIQVRQIMSQIFCSF